MPYQGGFLRPTNQWKETYWRDPMKRVANGVFDIIAETKNPFVTSAVIVAEDQKGKVLSSLPITPVQAGSIKQFTWPCPTTQMAEGCAALKLITTPPTPDILWGSLIICNSGKAIPANVPQRYPVGARNLTLEGVDNHIGGPTVYKASGFVWCDYIPGKKPKTAKLKKRISAGPVLFDTPNDQLWQQEMTGSTHLPYSFPSRRPVIMEDGHITGDFVNQTYNHGDAMSVLPGTMVDGYPNEGRAGPFTGGCTIPDGSGDVALCSPAGRFFRMSLEGKITTHIGLRLKADTWPHPRQYDMYGTNKEDKAMTYYEMVGGRRPNNPWEFELRMNGAVLECWEVDTDNDRVVVSNWNTGEVLKIITGFNKPRGIVLQPDGYAIANDHNSSLDLIKWDYTVITIAKSKRDNNDLVAAVGNFTSLNAYVEWIRTFMKDGPFNDCIFMHLNGIDKDSEGRIIGICHHPHVVVRFDRTLGTVETIIKPFVQMEIGYLKNSWCMIAIGPDNTIVLAWWQQDSLMAYKRVNDKYPASFTDVPPTAKRITGPNGITGLQNGPCDHCVGDDYPNGIFFAADGSFWHGGWAGEQVRRITPRVATDPVLDKDLYLKGETMYRSGDPSPHFAIGWRGWCQTGKMSFFELLQLTDAEIKNAIRTEWERPDLADSPDFPALLYYMKWVTMDFVPIDAVVVPPPGPTPPPPPPPPPAPVPLPTISNMTATPATLPVGGGAVVINATVTGATAITVDGTPVISLPVTLAATISRTFILVATNATGSVQATASVTVAVAPPPPIVNDTARLASVKAIIAKAATDAAAV